MQTPTLFSVVSETPMSLSNVRMSLLESWTDTRMQLLQKVSEYIGAHLGREKDVDELDRLFAELRPLGAKSAYGVVRLGCLGDHSTCRRFSFGTVHGNTLEDVKIYLIIKALRTYEHSPYTGLDAMKWKGNRNPLREVLVGRFLNKLVRARVSPHFPLIYDTFYVEDDPDQTFFTMELCDMDFRTFVRTLNDNRTTEPCKKLEILKVALIQITQALAAARQHYYFRHNDFHYENAMVQFVKNDVYTYIVDSKVYAVPNYGMCWKLIDFGFSSSSRLFEPTDSQKCLSYSNAFSIYGGVDFGALSVDLNDIFRLTNFFTDAHSQRCDQKCKTKCINAEFVKVNALLQQVSRESASANSMREVVDAYRLSDTGRAMAIIGQVEQSNENLPLRVFEAMARKYRVTSVKDSDNVYNLNNPVFTPLESFEGIEGEWYGVDASGKLFKRPTGDFAELIHQKNPIPLASPKLVRPRSSKSTPVFVSPVSVVGTPLFVSPSPVAKPKSSQTSAKSKPKSAVVVSAKPKSASTKPKSAVVVSAKPKSSAVVVSAKPKSVVVLQSPPLVSPKRIQRCTKPFEMLISPPSPTFELSWAPKKSSSPSKSVSAFFLLSPERPLKRKRTTGAAKKK